MILEPIWALDYHLEKHLGLTLVSQNSPNCRKMKSDHQVSPSARNVNNEVWDLFWVPKQSIAQGIPHAPSGVTIGSGP